MKTSKSSTVWDQIFRIGLIAILGFSCYLVFIKCVKTEKYTVDEKLKMTLWTVTVFDYMAQKGVLPGEFEFSVEQGRSNKYVLIEIYVNGKSYCRSEVNDKMLEMVQSIDISEITQTSILGKDLQNYIPLCLNYAIAAKGIDLTEGGEISMTSDRHGGKRLLYVSTVATVGNHFSVYVSSRGNDFGFLGGL